jgi:hypothetical protein
VPVPNRIRLCHKVIGFYSMPSDGRSVRTCMSEHTSWFRHVGATLAAQAGATTKELMARIGHTTPAT